MSGRRGTYGTGLALVTRLGPVCRRCRLGKTFILTLRSVNFEEVSHEMLVLMLQHVSSRVSGFRGAVAVSMGEAAKPFLVECFKAGCNVVLRGRGGTS